MPTALELEAQAHWEVEAAREGQRRYLERLANKDFIETPGVAGLLRRVIDAFAEKVVEAQREWRRYIGTVRNGGALGYLMPLVSIDPVVLAYVVAATALRSASGAASAHQGVPAPSLFTAVKIAEALVVQLEYDDWAAKASGKGADAAYRAALDALSQAGPKRRADVMRNWRKRLKAVRTDPWDVATKARVGSVLIKLLLEALPEWFVLVKTKRQSGPGEVDRVALTEAAERLMEDREARAQVAQPEHMPMLIPPVPWRWEPVEKEG